MGKSRQRHPGSRGAKAGERPVGPDRKRHPDLPAILIFLVLTVVLFADFVLSDGMLYGSDTIPSGIFFRGLYRDHVRAFGSIPTWDRYILCGLPFVDAMHGDTFYPAAVLQFLLPLHRALGYKLVMHVFLAGVGMFVFLRAFGLRRVSAGVGGLCYMFAPTLVSFVLAGHDAKMYVIALLPYQFYCLERGFQSRGIRPFLMLGGVAGLSILSSHNQMAFFSLWGVGLYFLFRVFFLAREEGGKGFEAGGRVLGFFAVAMLTALAVGAVQLLPTYIYVQKFSVRGSEEKTSFEHATSFSLHPEDIASLVVPEFGGYQDKGKDTYWGRNPFKLNSEYAGIIPLVFGVLALVLWRDRRKWFFLGGGILALLYGVTYHTPFFRLCYELLPGVRNFRAQGMIAFLFAFCACTLGASGIDRVLDRSEATGHDRRLRILKTIGIVALAGGVVGAVVTRQAIDTWIALFYHDIAGDKRQVLEAAYPGIRNGVLLCSGLALASTGIAWARIRKGVSPLALALGLGALALIDTWRIDRGFIQVVDHNLQPGFRSDGLIEGIKKMQGREGPFRVMDLTWTRLSGSGPYRRNELAAHGIETAGGAFDGFHDNELRWYRRFRGEGDARLLGGLTIDPDGNLTGVEKNPFLNLLDVRYVLHYNPGLKQPFQLVENRQAFNRAFVATSFQVLGSAEAVLERLEGEDEDFRKVVLLEEDPGWGAMPEWESGGVGEVSGLRYADDEVEVQVRMERKGVLVICDNYHPYWRATDNGRPIPVVRAYGALRAVCLEAGGHLVRLKYVSRPYQAGKWVTVISVLAVLAVSAGPRIRKLAGIRDLRH